MGKKKKKLYLKNDSCVIENGTLVWINPLLKEFEVPEGVEDIELGMVDEIDDIEEYRKSLLLEKIVFPDTLKTIGDYCFSECRFLKEVNIPKSVTCIYQCAFYKCKSLEKVIINSRRTAIDFGVFDGCNKLKELSLPNGYRAFGDGHEDRIRSEFIEKINIIWDDELYQNQNTRKLELDLGMDFSDDYLVHAPNICEINIIKKDDKMLLEEATDERLYLDLSSLLNHALGIVSNCNKNIDYKDIKVNFITENMEDTSYNTSDILNDILKYVGSIDTFIQFMFKICDRIKDMSLEEKKKVLLEICNNLREKESIERVLFTLLYGGDLTNNNSRRNELLLFNTSGFHEEKVAAVLDLALSNKSTSEILKEFNDKISRKDNEKETVRVKGKVK